MTSLLIFRTPCTAKTDDDLPRYGKRMQLDPRELKRKPHEVKVVNQATESSEVVQTVVNH